MSISEKPVRGMISEEIDHHIRLVGGTAAVTKVTDTGPGITVARTSAGVVTFTWADNPGTFVDAVASLQATTPGNVKSYVVVFGAYSTTAFTITANLYESGTLTDLDALEWLNVQFTFKRSGTGV